MPDMGKYDEETKTKIRVKAAETLEDEAEAISKLKERIDEEFVGACECILDCDARVVVTGMGKSGHIGRKIAASAAAIRHSVRINALFIVRSPQKAPEWYAAREQRSRRQQAQPRSRPAASGSVRELRSDVSRFLRGHSHTSLQRSGASHQDGRSFRRQRSAERLLV